MNWLKKIDHITYLVKPETIRKWAWFYIEVCGGKLVMRSDDVKPNSKSSMMLWCIDFGEFGIALAAGIDREEKSHVTRSVEANGDHFLQHPAFHVRDLEAFIKHASKHGVRFQGDMQVRNDGFGVTKQIFAWPYHGTRNAAVVGFQEYEERESEDTEITFSPKVGASLYDIAQEIMESDMRQTMVDWSCMPDDWEPPSDFYA